MRFAAAFLLVIAFVLDLLAGAGCVVLGLMGVDMLTGTLSSVLSMAADFAGDYSALVEREVDRAVAGVLALEGRLDYAVAQLGAFGISFAHALAAAGALVIIAGLLALTSAIQLLRQRSGTIIYIGCLAAIIADAAPLALIGFSYLQLPGLIGGLLGLVASWGLDQGVQSKPVAKPVATAKPSATTKPAETTKPPEAKRPPATIRVRPTVKTAEYQKRNADAAPWAFRRVAVLGSVVAIFIGGAVAAYLMYPKYFGQGGSKAPQHKTASIPSPAPAAAAPGKTASRALPKPVPEPVATIPTGPVEGQLSGSAFKPERVALKVTTDWTAAGRGLTRVAGGAVKSKGFERLSLVLDAGKDLRIEIEGLPEDYDFAAGLNLHVKKGRKKPGQPKLTLTTPQSGGGFPKTDFVSDHYDLDLELDPLRGNRINGRISLSLPSYKKTEFAGTFKAWVDGHPDIEPDLTRGGGPTFKYLAFNYLKDIHPGSEVAIKDDTYSHQVGDASNLLAGYIMVVYAVNGEETATILRIETSEGYWRVLDSLDATYLAEAHPIEVPDPKNEGQWVNYLAARQTEEWFREEHPGKYPWGVRFTGDSNTEVGYAEIHLSLKPYGEPDAIERRYYFLRNDGRWRYIRDLKEDEEIDKNSGKVVKKAIAKTS